MNNFDDVVQQYERMIWKNIHTLHIYKNKEDFFQIGLIALWEAYKGFDAEKGQFSSYAYSYIRGRMLNELNKRRTYEERMAAPDEDFWNNQMDESLPQPLEMEELQARLKRLTAHERKWVLYTVVQDLSTKQIAELENVSLSAVKAWKSRARKKLAEDWVQY